MEEIRGFLQQPKKAAGDRLYEGRFTCHDVQWAGRGEEALAIFTLTAAELADAAESRLLWTDQDVQRGIKPEANPQPARELQLADGYPDPKLYIFDADNANDIAEKLLRSDSGDRSDKREKKAKRDKLFLSPLIW